MTRSIATVFGLGVVLLRPIEARSADGDLPAVEWLRRAREQAEAVEEPAARARLFARIAVAFARLGDEAAFRRDLDRAKKALAAAPEKPGASPIDSAVVEATPSLITARAKAGDFQGAKALAEEHLRGREPYRAVWIADVAVAEAEAGRLDEALADLKTPSAYERARVLVPLAGVLARRGDPRVGQVVGMLGVDSRNGRDDALAAVALAQAETGRYAEALATLDAVGDEAIRNRTRADVAEAQAEAGDAEAARTTVAGLPESLRGDACTRVALAQLDRGDVVGARLTIANLADVEAQMQMVRSIAEAEVRAGRIDDVRRTAESIPAGRPERGEVFHILVGMLVRAESYDAAVQVAEEQSQVGWLAEIATFALMRNRRDEARRVVDRLRQASLARPDPTNSIASSLAVLEARLGEPRRLDEMIRGLEALLQGERAAAAVREEIEAILFGLYAGAGRMADVRRLVRGKSAQDISIKIAWATVAMAASGQLKRAEELIFLLPTPRSREDYVARLAVAHREASGDRAVATWIKGLSNPHDRAAACTCLGLTDPSLRRPPRLALTP